ncbi:hypothetical protein Esti_005165 [Eimeria stiedai]
MAAPPVKVRPTGFETVREHRVFEESAEKELKCLEVSENLQQRPHECTTITEKVTQHQAPLLTRKEEDGKEYLAIVGQAEASVECSTEKIDFPVTSAGEVGWTSKKKSEKGLKWRPDGTWSRAPRCASDEAWRCPLSECDIVKSFTNYVSVMRVNMFAKADGKRELCLTLRIRLSSKKKVQCMQIVHTRKRAPYRASGLAVDCDLRIKHLCLMLTNSKKHSNDLRAACKMPLRPAHHKNAMRKAGRNKMGFSKADCPSACAATPPRKRKGSPAAALPKAAGSESLEVSLLLHSLALTSQMLLPMSLDGGHIVHAQERWARLESLLFFPWSSRHLKTRGSKTRDGYVTRKKPPITLSVEALT